MINKIKQAWADFKIWHDDMQWNCSIDRKLLAKKRLAYHREWVENGCKGPNPYTHPDDFNFL